MDTPQRDGDTPPHPPLTQPPRAAVRRPAHHRAATQLPQEKRRAATTANRTQRPAPGAAREVNTSNEKLAEDVSSDDDEGDGQVWRTRSEREKETLRAFFGDVSDREDDANRMSDGTPTPGQRKKEGAPREPSPDLFAPAAQADEDPYGMGNTSMNTDMAYSLAENAGLDDVPLSQTGVNLVPRQPATQQASMDEDAAEAAPHGEPAGALPEGNPRKRARRDSSAGRPPEHDATPVSHGPQNGGGSVGPPIQHNQGDQAFQQAEALPPYAPPPPPAHAIMQPPMATTAPGAPGAVHMPAPVYPYPYPPQDLAQTRTLATMRLLHQREIAAVLAKKLRISVERAEHLLDAPYTGEGGVLSVLSKMPADAFWQGSTTPSPVPAATRTSRQQLAAPPSTGPAHQNTRTGQGRAARPLSSASTNGGGPMGLPMGPNRAQQATTAPQPIPASATGPTRDPRQRPPRQASVAHAPLPQTLPVHPPPPLAPAENAAADYDMGDDTQYAHWLPEFHNDELAELRSRIPEWAFQPLGAEEEALDGDRMDEYLEDAPPARTEIEYWEAVARLGLSQIPGDRFPEVHEREVGGRLRNCDETALEKWLTCPKTRRCLLTVFGIGNMDGDTVAAMQTRIEKILEEFLGTAAFRLDPPKENKRGIPASEAPKAWMLSNIPNLAKEIMLLVFGWSHQTVAFHVYDDDVDEIPDFVAALLGVSQKNGDKILAAIIEEFEQDTMMAALEEIFRVGPRQSAAQLRSLANAAIASIRIELRYANAANEESPRVVYIYMKTPGADPAKWAQWQRGLRGHTWSFGAGRVTTRRGIERCSGCHGTDHQVTHCPYLDRTKVPGWRTTPQHRKDDARQQRDDTHPRCPPGRDTAQRDRPRNAHAGPSRVRDNSNGWPDDRRPRDARRAQDEYRQRGYQDDGFYPDDDDDAAGDAWGAPQRPQKSQGQGTQRSRNGRR
ncbi:uncharacterized protein TRAVEDRAFT_52077 [Trametes versicolor FP-101664 SS1]|uniref:uncharacterized protein n=1 Tax=Trametes versicolor (strain FP-101664) TaxID=717944 RepID=UPI0004624042|nr:uncharacterized protein TRAVEDRAFT_52077 [Trametes versicolor FP-101664 SS1]EIW54370.1 hypothetical protein TRAVEDRAFT_52077 [Trametes versicolor FP-101664 SS1]